MEGPVILIIILGAIFGVFYLYFSTRNKERMALIEKGADASIFVKRGEKKPAPFWKVFVLNLSVLLIGIGAGVLFALLLDNLLNVNEEALYPGVIFLTSGIGLFVGFTLTKKLDKE